jgi:hypothetical protein
LINATSKAGAGVAEGSLMENRRALVGKLHFLEAEPAYPRAGTKQIFLLNDFTTLNGYRLTKFFVEMDFCIPV